MMIPDYTSTVNGGAHVADRGDMKGVLVRGSTTQIAFGRSICLVQVVNAPVAASNWYPTLTCGSSKLVFPSGHTPGNRHDRRTKPGEGLRCYSGHTPGNRHDRRAKPVNPRSNLPEWRTALVVRELVRYKVDIDALCETRFSEQGQLEEVGAGFTFLWSGLPKVE
ncbi:unnamed protein product [Schistocephalus solidus]|uniref:Uncharacterized protein n=1 Tax=Schistocephalus solidus TaxID=70667 RepID=A0A183TIN8_SCHSO|nr:unnamed protein product [Schistocephalus solidus]